MLLAGVHGSVQVQCRVAVLMPAKGFICARLWDVFDLATEAEGTPPARTQKLVP